MERWAVWDKNWTDPMINAERAVAVHGNKGSLRGLPANKSSTKINFSGGSHCKSGCNTLNGTHTFINTICSLANLSIHKSIHTDIVHHGGGDVRSIKGKGLPLKDSLFGGCFWEANTADIPFSY